MKNGCMNFATNLRRLRLAAGMTQEQLAHACGYSGQSRIGNYESSAPKARQPRPDELPNIAAALGVPVAALFGDAGPEVQSRSLRLDPQMMAETHKALREMEAKEGRKFSLEKEDYAAWFVHVYALRAGMSAEPTSEELVRKLAAITSQGAFDGRADGVPVKGTGTRNMA